MRDIDQQSISQTIDAMVAAEPELAWLKQAEAQGDVDWRQVKEIHDSWDYHQSGLGEGAALAVSIAATAAMPGIGTGLTGAMMTAAAGSLAGTSAVSLINNRGNLGATLGDTFSSESLKGALIAAASAGVSENLDSVWGGETDPATGRTIPHDLSSWRGTGRFAGQRASQALADGSSGKTALHALAGGLASQATGGDFRTGAIAEGANEALINQLDALVKGDRKLLIAASQITGIVAAGMADGDVQKGAEIAGNATAYNYLAHPEARRLQAINRLLEDDDTLTEAQRQALEKERLEINVLSQSRDRALEQAFGQGGSPGACRYERAQLQVAMGSWQDMTRGRENQDTVFAEYTHTARQYGQNQQQRMERIGAEALSEMAVDSASAPFILGTLAGQALSGDAESRALLQELGQNIKALAANPVSYISESNREQLARADALEQAGRLDDADKLRVRVALDNESMLMGTGGLLARLPRMAKSVITSRSMAGAGSISGGRTQDGVFPTTSGFTKLSSDSRKYLNDLELQTGLKVTPDQRDYLANALREQEFTKIPKDAATNHRNQFSRVKNDLVTQWEKNAGQAWPRYTEDVVAKNGVTVTRKAGQPYDAHHIIESSYGGPNEWQEHASCQVPKSTSRWCSLCRWCST